jgi:Tol biopolymer transport system component
MTKCLGKLLVPYLASLVFLPATTWSETSPGRMESVGVSPDGKTIAVDFIKDKKSHIYLIALDTGDATRLTNDNKGEESDLSFAGRQAHRLYLLSTRW